MGLIYIVNTLDPLAAISDRTITPKPNRLPMLVATIIHIPPTSTHHKNEEFQSSRIQNSSDLRRWECLRRELCYILLQEFGNSRKPLKAHTFKWFRPPNPSKIKQGARFRPCTRLQWLRIMEPEGIEAVCNFKAWSLETQSHCSNTIGKQTNVSANCDKD